MWEFSTSCLKNASLEVCLHTNGKIQNVWHLELTSHFDKLNSKNSLQRFFLNNWSNGLTNETRNTDGEKNQLL